MTYLEITTKNGRGRRTVELRDEPLRVGRARTNDVILRDTRVSRHHCVIEVVAGRPMIRDLGSVRGIKVNNRRREESDLRPGDRVRIGPFTIALRGETTEEKHACSALNGNGHALDGWDASEASDSDETATPDMHSLALADDARHGSRSDSTGVADDELGEAPARDDGTTLRLDELTEHIARLEHAASTRESALESLREEVVTLREEQLHVPTAEEVTVDDTAGAESAARLDQLAKNHEQVAFEHAQVALAVHELALRLTSIEESLQPIASLAARLTALDEAGQQSSINARQALEQASHVAEKLTEVQQITQQVAQSAEQRLADMTQSHTDTAATLSAHDEAIHHNSAELARLATLVEEACEQQRRGAVERARLSASVQSIEEQLGQMREWFDQLEERLAGAADSSSDSQVGEVHAEHQREIAALRNAVEAVGDRLSARIERLEGASADAAPELSALKEQVRRLSDARSGESAAPRTAITITRRAAAPASTAVLERTAPAVLPTPMPRKTAPGPAGPGAVPSSVDTEQSRKVMSRIFQGKEEQDERYRPARDHSATVILIAVTVLAIGVALTIFARLLGSAV